MEQLTSRTRSSSQVQSGLGWNPATRTRLHYALINTDSTFESQLSAPLTKRVGRVTVWVSTPDFGELYHAFSASWWFSFRFLVGVGFFLFHVIFLRMTPLLALRMEIWSRKDFLSRSPLAFGFRGVMFLLKAAVLPSLGADLKSN